jgi:hypothetical protein
VLNRKRRSFSKACDFTVRRYHGNTLRLAGLGCGSYIDGVIGAIAFAKARSARANQYASLVEADALHDPLWFLPCLPLPQFIRDVGWKPSTENVIQE